MGEIPKEIKIEGVLPLVIEHNRELPEWEYARLPADVPLVVLNEMGRIGWQVTVYISDANQLLLIREILPPPLSKEETETEEKKRLMREYFDPDHSRDNASNS